jgi:tRNA pseudouridine13 synthase
MPDLPLGRIKDCLEDFVVEEIAAYAPNGAGEHVFIRITKRDITTLDAARTLADALGCDPCAMGYAGMKDKRAGATQTISLHAPAAASWCRCSEARTRRSSQHFVASSMSW